MERVEGELAEAEAGERGRVSLSGCVGEEGVRVDGGRDAMVV